MKRLEKGTFGVFPAQLVKGKNPIYQTIVAWLWVHSNNEGKCYPSLNTIAQETGVHRTTVLRYLDEIEQDGLISREKKMIAGSQEYENTEYTVYEVPRTPLLPLSGGTDGKEVGAESDDVVAEDDMPDPSDKVGAENTNLGAQGDQVGADSDGGVGAQSDSNYTSIELNSNTPPIVPQGGKPKKKKVSKIYEKESDPYRFARTLFDLMRRNAPDCLPTCNDEEAREKKLQQWAETFDLVLRVDGRPPGDVELILAWSQTDDFWKTNILSAGKFREKYDQLKAQAKYKIPKTLTPRFKTV